MEAKISSSNSTKKLSWSTPKLQTLTQEQSIEGKSYNSTETGPFGAS